MAWDQAAPAEYVLRFQKQFATWLAYERFVRDREVEWNSGRRLPDLRLVIAGYVETKQEDDAISAGAPRMMYLGFGTFGLYPVQLRVAFVKVKRALN